MHGRPVLEPAEPLPARLQAPASQDRVDPGGRDLPATETSPGELGGDASRPVGGPEQRISDHGVLELGPGLARPAPGPVGGAQRVHPAGQNSLAPAIKQRPRDAELPAGLADVSQYLTARRMTRRRKSITLSLRVMTQILLPELLSTSRLESLE